MSCKWNNTCPLRRLEKKGLIVFNWSKEYCQSDNNWKNCKRYQAEENGLAHSDNMMPDGSFIELSENG